MNNPVAQRIAKARHAGRERRNRTVSAAVDYDFYAFNLV